MSSHARSSRKGSVPVWLIDVVARGLSTTLGFVWDSLFGLIFGFLISAVVQVVLTPRDMHRYLGGDARGLALATGFGIIASACSYGAAAAAKGLYQRGADARSVFAFLISSTNMNLAILILFWTMLGWKFAFAEFFGGVIIIAVVTTGISILFRGSALQDMKQRFDSASGVPSATVTACPLCSMEGEPELAVQYHGITYLACGRKHHAMLFEDPSRCENAVLARRSLGRLETWRAIVDTAVADVEMLWKELLIGYAVAGFAAAVVPQHALAHLLSALGGVAVFGYVLLLLAGLAIAVVTMLCSMGNVPIARYLATAGIPLGANTSFIYGDLLIPPLIAIYRKSFPPRLIVAFIALFIVGSLLAGAVMDLAIGHAFGGIAMGSMALSDHITNALNIVALVCVLLLVGVRVRATHAVGATR